MITEANSGRHGVGSPLTTGAAATAHSGRGGQRHWKAGVAVDDVCSDTGRSREPVRGALWPRRLRPPRLSARVGYAAAIAGVAVGALVEYAFVSKPAIAPFLVFFPCIAVIAWLAGRLPGLLAVQVSALAGNYFFLPPYRAWSLAQPALVATAFFVVSSAVVALAIASFRGAFLDFERLGTEQRRAQEALRRRETTLAQAGQMAHLGAWDIEVVEEDDLNANRHTWSDEVYRIFGYEPGAVTVTSDLFFERVHPDDRQLILDSVRESIATKRPFSIEHRIVRPDGHERIVQEHAELLFNDRGMLTRMICAVQDITEQKQAERSLRENEQRMKRTQEIAHLGSWELDLTTNRLSWSDEVYRIFGLERQEFSATYEAFLAAVHPDDRVAVDAAYSSSLREGKDSYEIEHRVVRRSNGEIRIVHEKCEHIRNDLGRIVRSVGMVHDITEAKRAEEACARNTAELEAVFSAMSDGILLHDRAGIVVRANIAARALYGSNPVGVDLEGLRKHLSGRSLDGRSLAHDEFPASRALRGERVAGQRLIVNAASGRDVIIECSSASLQIDSEPLGAVTVWHDISELMGAQKALSDADRHKNEFLAVLSHELRNPLAPIRNSLYILERAAPEGEQAKRAQRIIDRQVAHMTRLIDDLLDVTRVSRGKIQLQSNPLELGELVRRTVEDHRSVFAKGGVALEVIIPEPALWVHGDATRLAQVVGNLLQNAVKFTARGGQAWIAVEKDDEAEGAIVEIRDTGVGISAEMLPRVFEPFTQSAPTLDRTHGGLGLGLALVKGLVDLHGGTVEAHSDGAGKGARFSVWLPIQPMPHVAERAPIAVTRMVRCRVLVVEDNIDAAESLREALELDHHDVEVAFDGPQALNKARQLKPDVVLCDIGLPGMDGYAVARAFRADPELGCVFLVALTGYALPEDVAKAQEAGFDHHLAKPPTLEKIQQALATRVPRWTAQGPASATS